MSSFNFIMVFFSVLFNFVSTSSLPYLFFSMGKILHYLFSLSPMFFLSDHCSSSFLLLIPFRHLFPLSQFNFSWDCVTCAIYTTWVTFSKCFGGSARFLDFPGHVLTSFLYAEHLGLNKPSDYP